MSTENRVLALQLAISATVPDGGLAFDDADRLVLVAREFYWFLEGPAVLLLSLSETFDQAAPEGPGVPTVMRGNGMAQITDLQQYTVSVAEADSKGQPVTGDNLSWTIDNPGVATITPSADGYSALIVGVADGTANYTVSDNTVNPPLTGSGSVTVVSSAATSLVVNEGAPEDQPPAQ
jgi:hypothetical protein